MRAPRALACSNSSRTTTAAPSETTKPLRSASNGRQLAVGLSLYAVDRDLALPKPANVKGWIHDSEPPATITSASPMVINRAASPIECAPVVQAVVAVWLGPWKPYFMATWPAAIL